MSGIAIETHLKRVFYKVFTKFGIQAHSAPIQDDLNSNEFISFTYRVMTVNCFKSLILKTFCKFPEVSSVHKTTHPAIINSLQMVIAYGTKEDNSLKVSIFL